MRFIAPLLSILLVCGIACNDSRSNIDDQGNVRVSRVARTSEEIVGGTGVCKATWGDVVKFSPQAVKNVVTATVGGGDVKVRQIRRQTWSGGRKIGGGYMVIDPGLDSVDAVIVYARGEGENVTAEVVCLPFGSCDTSFVRSIVDEIESLTEEAGGPGAAFYE